MFTKKQQNGILLLVILIVVVQGVYYFIDFPPQKTEIDQVQLIAFEKELDSLRLLAIESHKPKQYPFNPNFITDYKGYTLGMTNEEIDRLLSYRKQNKWINSKEQFQEVTQISDDLLAEISPYFKFPEWVINPKRKKTSSSTNYKLSKPKSFDEKIDLNLASKSQLKSINGIGDVLSSRIIKYRNKFKGGFISDVQLQDVYGLSSDVIERIKEQFTVKTPRQVHKIDLNKATIEQLVIVQYIDYELAYEIINERILREGFDNLDELTKVKDFPIEKIEIIKLYLRLQ